MNTQKKIFNKYKQLPFYIRIAEFSSNNSSSIICILKSNRHQTNAYHRTKFYKPIINNHVKI